MSDGWAPIASLRPYDTTTGNTEGKRKVTNEKYPKGFIPSITLQTSSLYLVAQQTEALLLQKSLYIDLIG